MIYWVIASINNPYCQTGTGTFQNKTAGGLIYYRT